MKSRVFIYLCDESREIRKRVFVEEQGFEEEFDTTDKRSIHVVVYDDEGKAVGTGRTFADGDGVYSIGRVAVEKNSRSKGVGEYIMNRLVDECRRHHAKKVQLWSQEHAVGFYEKTGFVADGQTMLEQGVMHMRMEMCI